MSKEQVSRRGLLRGAAAASIAAALPKFAEGSGRQRGRRVLRIAHITDCHVTPEKRAPQGLARCLERLQTQHSPDLLFNGGDSIYDAFSHGSASVAIQWATFHKVMADHCDLPTVHCLGNHDLWGWDKRASGASGAEARFGKRWAMDELGLSSTYRSFDRAGWHFIVLDSIQPSCGPVGYVARLDQAQFDWLERDLAQTPESTPVVVLSHCPILSVSAYFRMHAEDGGTWRVPGSWMHIDARKIKDLFRGHPNVKLCLAGHEHLVGKTQYLGVTYACNGSVSGAWWEGPFQETEPGYSIVDLFDDGTHRVRYFPWGWTPA